MNDKSAVSTDAGSIPNNIHATKMSIKRKKKARPATISPASTRGVSKLTPSSTSTLTRKRSQSSTKKSTKSSARPSTKLTKQKNSKETRNTPSGHGVKFGKKLNLLGSDIESYIGHCWIVAKIEKYNDNKHNDKKANSIVNDIMNVMETEMNPPVRFMKAGNGKRWSVRR